MRLIWLAIFNLIACSTNDQAEKIDLSNEWDRDGWNLIWQDEFNDSSLDLSKWSHEIGGHGFGNNELEYYTNDSANSFVQDSMLHIRAKFEPSGIGDANNLRYFSSARLRTAGKGDWKYGRIDVRAKLALGQGIWPAIWMLPTDWIYGGWPGSGEIDIMEHVGHDEGRVHVSVHTESYNHKIGTQRTKTIMLSDVKDSFHIYSIEWYEDRIDFFIDDTKYFTFANDNNNDYKTWPFNQRFHLLINVAVGGDWPGAPDNTTVFPQEMNIDYVRVYIPKVQ